LSQCEQFVFDGKGGVKHVKSEGNEESSGNKEQHGDLCMSDALLVMAMQEVPAAIKPKFEAPDGCLYLRQQARREEERQDKNSWVA